MPTEHDELSQRAREEARRLLSHSRAFQALPYDEKVSMYRDVVNAQAAALAHPGSGMAGALAEKAGDLINDKRHENRRIEQAGELAGEFIDEVDFPQFVADLLEGVFDANLEVTLKQMSAYQELLKTATQSVSKFVNAIDDAASFGYLVENNADDDLSLDFLDEKDDEGQPKAALVDKEGNVVATAGEDIGDNALKARIMDAKIAMAKEQRALLRETILMGITRLVVEKGIVKASVLFDIKASEKIAKADKAAIKDTHTRSRELHASTGLVGKIFGGGGGGTTDSRRKTKVSVSSAKSQSETELAAQLKGYVEINFKSDYFKLDNFAQMYGPTTPEERAAAGAQGDGAGGR